MDEFVPKELRVKRDNGEDFYIETKMTVESYLKILDLQTEIRETDEQLTTPLNFIFGEQD